MTKENQSKTTSSLCHSGMIARLETTLHTAQQNKNQTEECLCMKVRRTAKIKVIFLAFKCIKMTLQLISVNLVTISYSFWNSELTLFLNGQVKSILKKCKIIGNSTPRDAHSIGLSDTMLSAIHMIPKTNSSV